MARVTQDHVDARRRQIFEAARVVFGRMGLDGSAATISDIAVEAGLSVGSIYSYFRDKEALIEEIEAEAVKADRELFAHLDRPSSSWDAVWAVADWMWDGLLDDGRRDLNMLTLERWLLQARNSRDAGKEGTDTVVEGLAELISEAQSDGRITSDLTAHDLANTLFCAMQGVRAQYLRTGDVEGSVAVLTTMRTLFARSVEPKSDAHARGQ